MPVYTLKCHLCGEQKDAYVSYADYDAGAFPDCTERSCRDLEVPCQPMVNFPSLYGMMRVKDQAFSDAHEATGCEISSTKDIDRLEKAGVIRAITNPSTYKFANGKKLRNR